MHIQMVTNLTHCSVPYFVLFLFYTVCWRFTSILQDNLALLKDIKEFYGMDAS